MTRANFIVYFILYQVDRADLPIYLVQKSGLKNQILCFSINNWPYSLSVFVKKDQVLLFGVLQFYNRGVFIAVFLIDKDSF